MDLTEAVDIKKRWQEYTEELYKKDLHPLKKERAARSVSCLENPVDREAWWAAVHGVARVGPD